MQRREDSLREEKKRKKEKGPAWGKLLGRREDEEGKWDADILYMQSFPICPKAIPRCPVSWVHTYAGSERANYVTELFFFPD